MFIVISFMFAGIACGYFLRRWKITLIYKIILTLIWLLLFLLGLEVGVNQVIISQFGRLGLQAFFLAAGATFGSVLFAWFLWLSITDKSEQK